MHVITRKRLNEFAGKNPDAKSAFARWYAIMRKSRKNNMSVAELEKVTKAWLPISRAVRVPHTEEDYRDLVQLLDGLTDEVREVAAATARFTHGCARSPHRKIRG